MLPVIVFYVGCAFILLGLISGANYLFDLELAIRRHVLPADWRIALLGVLGGACVAVWGRVLGSRAYRDAVAGHGWIPWVVWPVLSIVGLFAIFLAVQ
ncbi:MAG: hypothetical protein JXR96_00065 [Deltaproteobacteria bacterium]|nr:hypothetical protein [Deltaproteobacteria bacterium]